MNTGGPPPTSGARSDSTGLPRRPLLIWVDTGTAHVRIDGAEAFHLKAGAGASIPTDGWSHRAVVTEPGTVAGTVAASGQINAEQINPAVAGGFRAEGDHQVRSTGAGVADQTQRQALGP